MIYFRTNCNNANNINAAPYVEHDNSYPTTRRKYERPPLIPELRLHSKNNEIIYLIHELGVINIFIYLLKVIGLKFCLSPNFDLDLSEIFKADLELNI